MTSVNLGVNGVEVMTTAGGSHNWYKASGEDQYDELFGGTQSVYADGFGIGASDTVITIPASPSQPTSSLKVIAPAPGDEGFIDVIIYVELP